MLDKKNSGSALIHFDYTRYFHYYRIRKVFRSLFFIFFFNTDDEKRKDNAL